MLQGAIFDLDGVLVNSHPAHVNAWKKLLLDCDKPATEADLEIVRQGRKREEILRHFFGELPSEQSLAFARQKDMLFRDEEPGIQPIPGVRLLLYELTDAGIPLAVASSGSRERVLRLLHTLGLDEYFAVKVTGDDVAYGKPAPEIFRKAAEELHVPPEESLVFEDCVSGVQAALAAGMKCLGVASDERAGDLLRAGAARVIPDFDAASVDQIQQLFH